MDKIILTNGNAYISTDVTSGNSLRVFDQLLKSICNKKQIDTFAKPKGDWKRYEHRDNNNELIQCSFWFI